MPECLIFDLFGTLVEYEAGRTSQDYSRCYTRARDLGCDVSYEHFIQLWDSAFQQKEKETAREQDEFHMLDVCDLVIAALPIEASPVDKEALVRLYIDAWSDRVVPVPGAAGLLARLAGHYRLALISNTHYPPMVHRLLEEMAITNLFDVVTLSVDVGKAKPHPKVFELTLDGLGVKAGAATYIGDSYEHDYKGAKDVGMDCYLIGRHARVPRDRQLRNILDLAISFETARKTRKN